MGFTMMVDGVAFEEEDARQSSYLLGLMEDADADQPRVMHVKTPLDQAALLNLLRILRGEGVEAVCRSLGGENRGGSDEERGEKEEQEEGSTESMHGLVSMLISASFLHAQMAEDAILNHLARYLTTSCRSSWELRSRCGLGHGPLSRHEEEVVRRMINKSGLQDDHLNELLREGKVERAMGEMQRCSAAQAEGRRDGTETFHGAIAVAAIESLSSFSPLRLLHEDLICLLMEKVAVIVVPDDGRVEEAVSKVRDFKETGQRVRVRGGEYEMDCCLAIKDRVVLMEAFNEERVCVKSRANSIFLVGASSQGLLGPQERRNSMLVLERIHLQQLEEFRPPESEEVEALGYWEGGPVAVRVEEGELVMHACSISSDFGSAVIAEGEKPGTLPYLVDESNEFAGQLLPYTEENFLTPCSSSRRAHARLHRVHLGPCRGSNGCGAVASMRGRVLLDSCRIEEIGLDGAVASVGGQLDVIDSFICSCGESGIVASGVSTYEHEKAKVERSMARATDCSIQHCKEEALWACESALLLHSNCKVTECEGDAREVTGGKIRSERVRDAITGVFLTQQEKRTT